MSDVVLPGVPYSYCPEDVQVQVVIPHVGDPEPLFASVPLWLSQSVPCCVCIVDTGSSLEDWNDLQLLRDSRVEVHSIRAHSYRHRSEPVAVALDFAAAVCQQQYQFHTHCDVFPMRKDLVESFMSKCSDEFPVVGYEISDRSHCSGKMADLWQGMVGHTATLVRLPEIRRLGIQWNLSIGWEQFGLSVSCPQDTDTEVPFNLQLRRLGIDPILVGHDKNHQRHITEDFDHCRSFPSSGLYSPVYHKEAGGWIKDAVEDARKRLESWTEEVSSYG